MRKTKIILASICVIGILGGIIANKANAWYGARLWITTVYNTPCTVSVAAITIPSGTRVYTTAVPGAFCTVYTATTFIAQ